MITVQDIQKAGIRHFYTFVEYICRQTTGYPDYTEISPARWIDHPDDDTKEFEHVRLTELPNNTVLPDQPLFFTIPYCTGGDYCGTTIELSNFKVFLEKYGDLPFVYRLWSGYGGFGIAVAVSGMIDPSNEEKAEEILDEIRELRRYPCIDEDHLSNMEYELEYEYVTTDGFKYDFNREMEKQHGITIAEITEDQAWEYYRELQERTNEYPVFETNGWPYVDWEKLAGAYVIGDLTARGIPHELTEE